MKHLCEKYSDKSILWKISAYRRTNFSKSARRSPSFRLLASILAILLTVSVLAPLLPALQVQAAGSTQDIANVVIFVKEKGDTADVFNARSQYSNWEEIKKMYNTGEADYNNSFSNYISVITEGRLKVTNYFPQESADGTKVATYTLSGSSMDRDAIVSEVLRAINNGAIHVDTSSRKLDNLTGGTLDNLTIVVQKVTDSSSQREACFKANYAGSEKLGSLRVGNYNMLYSYYLVSKDGSDKAASRQGVIAHEFLHTLGLPDLYRSNDSGDPVGRWDIMASVSRYLQYPLSYLRARQGWVSMGTITQSGTYTLTAVSEPSNGNENKMFVLKTPLTDTELICLEYRKKNNDPSKFEYSIPSSGLLMYRVDNKVDGLTNNGGKNYIYVYRPGVSNPEAASDTGADKLNLHWQSALDGTIGKGSYGSTDLSADYTQNTLYYSDGRNSGIRISDVKPSADGTKVTFTVTFADYSKAELWEKVGGTLESNIQQDPCLYSDPDTGALYIAYIENSLLYVRRWDGKNWQQVGAPISQSSIPTTSPALAVCGGTLYLACADAGNNAAYYKLNGTSWSKIASYNDGYPTYMQFIADGDELYGAYQSNNRLVIRNVKTGTLVTNSLSATDFSNPALVKLGDCFYMVCTEMGSANSASKVGHIKMYDTTKKTWSNVYTFADCFTNEHCIIKQGQKLYAFASYQLEKKAFLAEFDGNSWRSSSIPAMASAYSVSMNVIDNEVYLSYYDNADQRSKVLKRTGSSYRLYNDTLGTGLRYQSACSSSGTLYAVTVAKNVNSLTIWKKTVSTAQSETPSVGQKPLQLALTPPSGYEDNHIYVDGIEYTAQKSGGSYSVTLPNTSGKTAVMYCYNANKVPVGMYVWKLSWQGQTCKATPLPGLQDLLSYHGFSIRVKAPAGIRFTSGIDVSLKRQLLTSGVNGCRLTEYGTLVIPNAVRDKYPLVKGGEMVRGGRSYWTENGKVNDMVFSTVAGRNYFTSVLINLSSQMYATDLCFRSYAVLTCDGQELVIYGPPVYKSIYTIAKQVQARNEFKAGSSGYKYVQGIIDSVERK